MSEIKKFFKTKLAQENWEIKYKYQNENQLDSFKRAAKQLASVEKDSEYWEKEFLNTMLKFDSEGNVEGIKFTLGGRIFANIGTDYKNASLFNCYGLGPVKNATISYERNVPGLDIKIPVVYKTPDTGDDLKNIILTLMEQACTLGSEGGYGFNVSFIRPRGSVVRGVGIEHPGAIKFLDLFDKMSEIIVSGNNDGYKYPLLNHMSETEIKSLKNYFGDLIKIMARKGACLAALDVSHPDIEEFIVAKQTPGRLTKFNLSVLISDDFMSAVESDSMWDLTFDSVLYKRVKAKELYDLIMKSTYNRAEPGVLFYNNMQKNNPIEYLGSCVNTNPCQPGWAKILTEKGIRNLFDVNIGDRIWSETGWTTIINKIYSGVKPVYRYGTTFGCFYGTKNHKVISENKKIEVENAKSIDILRGYNCSESNIILPQFVIDGIVFGDGSVHKASNNKIYLYIGGKDQDYFNSEISAFIGQKNKIDSIFSYDVLTTLSFEELPLTYNRKIPSRFINGNSDEKRSFLRGLYTANGSICGGRVTLKSSSFKVIEDVQMMLSSLGVASYYTTNKPTKIKFNNGEYVCKKSYDLNISRDINLFCNKIGFIQKYKMDKLKSILENKKIHPIKEKISKDIISVDFVNEDDVFDITVDNSTHTYWTQGLNVSNCGEVGINPHSSTVCLLGSINLTQYVRKDRSFDFVTYEKDIAIAARFLDNVNDLQKQDLPMYMWAIKNVRQYGMGLNGFGSMLYMLGIPYNSQEAIDLAEKLSRIKMNVCLKTSALLAQEKGVAPAYNKELYENTLYWKEYIKGKIDSDIIVLVEKNGVRNLKQTTQPPLGNSSVICDNVSNSEEPIFTEVVERKYITDKWPDGLNQENVKDILKEEKIGSVSIWRGKYNDIEYYYEPHNRGLCKIEILEDYGYAWVKENYPEDIVNKAKYLVTTQNLSVQDHLNIQTVFQKYVDQSVSKTTNIPNNYSFDDFKDLYLKAWKLGLNGFTTYREGTMESVLSKIETQEQTNERQVIKEVKLPKKFINGPCEVIKREGLKFYIHFSYLEEDINKSFPIAMWIQTNHSFTGEGNHVKKAVKSLEKLLLSFEIESWKIDAQLEKISNNTLNTKLAKMISMCLRHNIPIVSIVVALENIDGDNISSLLTATRKFLSSHIKDGEKIKNKKCSGCKGDNLVFESGCSKCLDCGASNCG